MTVDLLEPVLSGGIRTTHFFNGRLLTADDFQTLQRAVVAREQRLGRAIGDGVVTGLEVTLDSGASTTERPIVRVTSGLAINGEGTVLALPADTTVGLTREVAVAPLGNAEFNACPPPGPQPQPPSSALTNVGFYILTVLPASGYEGRAPMTGLDQEGVGGSCGSRYAVSGVRFRLVRVPIAADSTSTTLRRNVVQVAGELNTLIPQLAVQNPPLSLQRDVIRKTSRLRNGIAHLCLGSDRWQEYPTDPLGFLGSAVQPGTFLGELREGDFLTDAEVPLGLVWWTSQGVGFVDQWAVRRMIGSVAEDDAVPAIRVDQLRQFLAQMAALVASSGIVATSAIRANDFFYFLPPIGILPLAGLGGSVGIDVTQFFDGRKPSKVLYLEGAKIRALVRLALQYPPIDVQSTEMMWVYVVRDNRRAIDTGSISIRRPVVLFTNGQVPNHGQARFDLGYWDYANYA